MAFESDDMNMVSAHHNHETLGVSASLVECDVDGSLSTEGDVNSFTVLVGSLSLLELFAVIAAPAPPF